MNRFSALESDTAHQPMPLTYREREGLVAEVRDASVAIDALWRNARTEGKDFTAAELRQASEAVHRALAILIPR